MGYFDKKWHIIYNIEDKHLSHISFKARWDGKRRFRVVPKQWCFVFIESFQEIIRKEDDSISILVALVVGIVSSVSATYIVRFIDKKMHKNNRHESK